LGRQHRGQSTCFSGDREEPEKDPGSSSQGTRMQAAKLARKGLWECHYQKLREFCPVWEMFTPDLFRLASCTKNETVQLWPSAR